MPHVANAAELQELARDLSALKAELMLCATSIEVDAVVDRYVQAKLFHRLKPAARQVLCEIINRRMCEIEAAEVCGNIAAAMAEHDEHTKLLAMARGMGR